MPYLLRTGFGRTSFGSTHGTLPPIDGAIGSPRRLCLSAARRRPFSMAMLSAKRASMSFGFSPSVSSTIRSVWVGLLLRRRRVALAERTVGVVTLESGARWAEQDLFKRAIVIDQLLKGQLADVVHI